MNKNMIFFSFILGMVTVKHSALYACVSAFCILFYFFLLYTMCWEIGAKDKLRVEGGRMDPAPFKGALLSLVANAVNLLGALTALISKLCLPFAEDLSLWQRLSSPAGHPTSEAAQNAEAAADTTPLTEAEQAKIAEIRKFLGNNFCRRCNYCAPCSAGIPISAVFLMEGYYSRYNLKEWAVARYEALAHTAADCIDCGLCEERCPYDLPIREMLKKVEKVFGV